VEGSRPGHKVFGNPNNTGKIASADRIGTAFSSKVVERCDPVRRVDLMSLRTDLMPKALKMLLAEDQRSLCRYIETLLSRWDCEVVVEQTAACAARRAAALKPDVALLGYITPGLNVAEAGIELLRASPGTRIVLTVESVPREVLDGLQTRGYGFRALPAPFKIEELQDLCFPSLHPRMR